MNNGVATTTGTANKLPFNADKNFASDKEVVLWVQQNLLPVIEYARYDRQALEEEWREIRRMVLLQHDDNRKYIGRSEAYIPAYAKARDTVISQLARALFPSEDYLDVRMRNDGVLTEAKAAKDYIQLEFEKRAKVRFTIKEFLSQFIDYGITVAKVWYEKGDSYKAFRTAKRKGPDDPLSFERAPSNTEGSRFSTRSMFYWYIWPTTVASVDEATVCFEDIDISVIDAERLAGQGIYENIEQAKASDGREPLHDMNVMQQQQEVMNSPSNPRTSPSPGGPLSRILTATECWLDMPIPASEYAEDEKVGSYVPCKVTVIGGVVVEARRNPFFHQKKPYLVQRMRTFAGSFYPKGTGSMSRYLQYLINDFTNQLNDNGTYSLNPVAKVNPNTLAGPLPGLRPGAVLPTTDPQNGIIFDRPPVEQLQYGKMLADGYEGKLFDVAGAPPILQGTNSGKGARTATSSQILQKNASNPIQDTVEDTEVFVMVPLMEWVWSFGNQYRTTPITDELFGNVVTIQPDDLTGDAVLRFLASSQAANQQQRAQQAMMLLQILPPLIPLLQQSGQMADPTPLLKRIYTDGFGFRNFEEFIKSVPQVVQTGMPGAVPPGQPAPGENAGDSAIPEEGEAAPGEGEDFANVRDNADVLSMLGGMQQG